MPDELLSVASLHALLRCQPLFCPEEVERRSSVDRPSATDSDQLCARFEPVSQVVPPEDSLLIDLCPTCASKVVSRNDVRYFRRATTTHARHIFRDAEHS